MKATIQMNGNPVQVECTPTEFKELMGTQERVKRKYERKNPIVRRKKRGRKRVNQHKKWYQSDDNTLFKLKTGGLSMSKIGKRMGRTTPSVNTRWSNIRKRGLRNGKNHKVSTL